MASEIKHRGSDQNGFYEEDAVSLGHQRLSIIDTSSHGLQPMTNEDGTLWLTFNGEIYNFQELRQELLAKGHRFQSRTDSEVIVHAYEQWGTDCLRRFQGMFAFALWDSVQKTLFAARDRLGIKPFYYYFHEGDFVFASEIKAILKAPQVQRKIVPQALYEAVGYEFVPSPHTMFEHILKLEPGHYLILQDRRLVVQRYWDIRFEPIQQKRQWFEEKLVDLLDKTVQSHLISDVPLGVFLSGGIDSTSVLALMRRHVTGSIRTFSIGYSDKTFSEFDYAKRASQRFGTTHTEILMPPITPELIEKAVWHFDEPTTDLSNIPFLVLCQKARERVTVCLSGDGGDELFAGYDRFRASKANRFYGMLPALARHNLIKPLVDRLADRPQKKGAVNILKRFIEGAHLAPEGLHLRWQYFLNQEQTASLFSQDFQQSVDLSPFAPVERYLNSQVFQTPLDQELYVELKTVLLDSVLMKVDKMSMASALEVRVPFLDHKFVEFCASIPSGLKLEGFLAKSIFKSAMKPHISESIAYRKKQGFSFPIKNWLRQELKDYMTDTLKSSRIVRQYFQTEAVDRLMHQHLARTHNHNHILWSLINLDIWDRQ